MRRGDARGPAYAVLVVALLDDGRQRTRDADAIASHDVGLLDAVGIHERRAHGLGILRSQLEDLAYLDAAGAGEHLAAIGAQVARLCQHEVNPGIGFEIATGFGAQEVVAVLVCADGPGMRVLERDVADADDPLGQADGTHGALVQAGVEHLLVGKQAPPLDRVFGLDVVELMVARNEQGIDPAVGTRTRQGLERRGRWQDRLWCARPVSRFSRAHASHPTPS